MDNNNIPGEKELLLRVAGGDEKAFRQLYLAYNPMVYSVALSFTKNQAVSEEIVQDIFLRIWLKRDNLPEINDINNWLFIVTRNKAFKLLQKMALEEKAGRQRAGRAAGEAVISAGQVTEVLEYREFRGLLQEAMDLLSPQQQKVFELIKVQGYSRNEAAEALGISPHTVKIHLGLSMPSVRKFLLKKLGETMIFFLVWAGF